MENLQDVGLRTSLLERLQAIKEINAYQNVMIASPDGRLLLSVDAGLADLDPGGRALAAQVISSKQAAFGDFSRGPYASLVYLDVAAPILAGNNQPAAVLILRTDPQNYLYPLIQSWPTLSESAETLLVRRDGDSVLYLNTLRHSLDQPLTLHVSMSNSDVPAVQAVLGRTGIFEGIDYRGTPVLAELLPVPDSPWFMVAKVNTTEILADLAYHGQVVLFLSTLAILMTLSLAAFFYTYRQRFFYLKLFQAEQERRLAQEEIRATLYGIGDGVIATDAAGCVTRLNPTAEHLTGWSEAEALGKPLNQVFHIVSEQTRQEVPNPAELVLREGGVVGLASHTLLIARDGSERAIADSAAPIRSDDQSLSGVVLVFRDQEQERAVQKTLRASQQKFMTIFQSSPDAIMLSSVPDGRLQDVNQGAALLTGYLREEMLGRTSTELGLWADLSDRQTYTEQIQSLGHMSGFEAGFRTKNGVLITVLISGEIVQLEDGEYYLSVVRDITERKLAERALAYEKEELTRSNAELEQFAYVASHDLQEPLRMVSSYMQLIEKRYKGKLDENADEFINYAVDGAVRMQRLINDLLSFSRVGSRGKPFELVSVEAVLAQAVRNLQLSIEESGAEITHQPLPDVLADESQLVLLFQNLIGNAIKFHGDRAPRMHISIESGPEEWVFALRDNGIGIDPQYFERIFVLFQRLHERSAYSGTGIGLAICKKIVQRHGGNIWVESQPGQGATFYFSLPKPATAG